MTNQTQSIDNNQVVKLGTKVAESRSRRSAVRRRRHHKSSASESSSSSSISGISSCGSESIDILSSTGSLDEAQYFSIGGSSINESFNATVACEPIEEEEEDSILKLTVDVPLQYYGDYRTVDQNMFFMECMLDATDETCSIVHFFDENSPTSIELDLILREMAKKHTACKVLRIDGVTTPFVCSKLKIDSFPTILALRNKVVLHQLSKFDSPTRREDIEELFLQLL